MGRPNQGSSSASWVEAWGPACVWALVIWYASSLIIVPGIFPPIPHGDTWFHAGEFFVYGYLVARGVVQRRWPIRRHAWAVVVIVALTAGLDEWHQVFVPTRTADVLDALTDVAGGMVGLIGYAKASRA